MRNGYRHRNVVDALDESAARFYSHYDFTPVKDNPQRLVLKMVTVRRLLGLADLP